MKTHSISTIGVCLGFLLIFMIGCSDSGDSFSPLASGTIPPAKIINHPPAIKCIDCSASETYPSGKVALVVHALDPDEDVLTYTFINSDGSLTANNEKAVWVMPSVEGSYPVKVIVSDGIDEASCEISVVVKQIPVLPMRD